MARSWMSVLWMAVLVTMSAIGARAQDVVIVGGQGRTCNDDPACINRLHPDIPMVARARPGQTIVLHTRNASDFDLDPASTYVDPRADGPAVSTVHPLTGPVYIAGAEAGDVLAVTLLDIEPGPFGYTSLSSIGFISDQFDETLRLLWRLNRTEAVSDDLPGVRIPNNSFPGVVTVLPGRAQLDEILARETALAAVGGAVFAPEPANATPAQVCGTDAPGAGECLRTIPPREHGGNLDIRYFGVGVTVYLPCYLDGCGLAVGDLHFAQGDGEVSGTAIEMDATVMLTTEVIKDGPALARGPHYAGPARLLDIPSRRFYATTGFPVKQPGEVPPDMAYLDSGRVAPLGNLSKDISLAARNALLEMGDYISQTYGLTRAQSYLVASVAVDLRIGPLVDAPNVGVTAILPLDVFADR